MPPSGTAPTAGIPAGSGAPSVYYRVEDATGKVTVVDSLEKLPAAVRGQAERVLLDGEPAVHGDRAAEERTTASPHPRGLDPGSFALGLGAGLLGAALAAVLLSRAAAGTTRWVIRGALLLGLAVLVVGAYLGWVRRAAGLDEATLASPRQLVEDARDATDRVRERRAADQRQLEELERIAR